ncbi:MAG: glutamine-hydrolyzing carbamoyl-phosphate synthase small subunit [Clostridia bacterium]|nr:glutamine-hydrolyzing carbamoyl-phosphate synthase small subunit [Clostridia bacterium]MBN2884171.1 glutamine-hydrolyzing carbamoyl-phosphate synthase small subunit [Clostridia bacterium]
MKAVLVLRDGTYFAGESFGAGGEAYGEIVFNTSMTGYQEITTDPSYNGQMVCMTYPLIGNYGMNSLDTESYKTHVEGFIVKELCETHSNFRAETSPLSYFIENGITGIKGIDTRALTRHIRSHGSMFGVISTISGNIAGLLEKIAEMESRPRNLVEEVSMGTKYHIKGAGPHVCLMDFGSKTNIIRSLQKRGCAITVMPWNSRADEIINQKPDGILLSNGPGDPRELPLVIPEIKKLAFSGTPLLGICLGHQLLALSLGMDIYKLKFGHHGGNHPVKDLISGKCHITSQNHNYAVSLDNIPKGIEATHMNVNDGTSEGIRHTELPVSSIQYHPEASPGPEDSTYIFDDFIGIMRKYNNA